MRPCLHLVLRQKAASGSPSPRGAQFFLLSARDEHVLCGHSAHAILPPCTGPHSSPPRCYFHSISALRRARFLKVQDIMAKEIIPIQFNGQGGIEYKGWATPSDQRHDDGYPRSYHVVLNQVYFGNLSLDRGKWIADEPRPRDLIVAVGACLDNLHASVRNIG